MKNGKPENIDDYINGFDGECRSRLNNIRTAIHKAFPASTESIRYGMPAFNYKGTYVYFSIYRNHIGMYPAYGLPELEEKIKPFRGKGTRDSLHFLHKETLPLKLIMDIVKAKFRQKTLQ